MKATQFEFRFRLWIGVAIYVVGFWAPWLRYGSSARPAGTTWIELWGSLARYLPLQTAAVIIISAAILLAAVGTFLRVWGTAYLSNSVVRSGQMHARDVVASGPYRYLRNPLYFGSIVFMLGVAILMPLSGAVFALVASVIQKLRLILREESYLQAQQGQAYVAYKSRVPRLFPSPVPCVAGSPAHPHWGHAIVAEIFYVAMTGCFAALAWRYNSSLLTRALLVCFGLSLVVRAFATTPEKAKRGDGPQSVSLSL